MFKYFILGFILMAMAIAVVMFVYRGSVAIEAQIIYNMGGPQPVARQDFYVMRVDPLFIPGATSENAGLVFTGMVAAFTMSGTAPGTDAATLKQNLAYFYQAKPFWQPYVAGTMQTDFKGLATCSGLRPGQYWLMGIAETRSGVAFWSLPIQVKAFQTKTLLVDQSNALFSK